MAENSTPSGFSRLDANQVLRQSYDDENQRLRVGATVEATIGTVDVHIQASAGDNIAITDPTGTNAILPNMDGSINAVIQDIELNQVTDSVAIGDGNTLIFVDPSTRALLVTLDSTNLTTKNIFNEIENIPSGVTSIVVQVTATANTKLLSCDFGGTNVATFSLYIGTNLSAKKYTYFQTLNDKFDFKDGLPITLGDVISLEVIHNRPDPGTFSVNMLILN